MRTRLLAAALPALLSSPVLAFDPAQANRYPSPDLYRPSVDRLVIAGDGVTCAAGAACDASPLRVRPSATAPADTLARLFYSPAFPGGLQQARTGAFYADDPVPARINRLADRAFVGSAVVNDGKNPDRSTARDPMELLRPFTTAIAQLSVGSTVGAIGVAAFSRTSDSALPGAMGTIALDGIVNNNNATQVQYAYGGYLEARRQAGAGTTHAQENDIANFGSVVDLWPGTFLGAQPTCLTTGLWLASGAGGAAELGKAPAAASVGLAILNNGASYRKGIVFAANALDGMTGGADETTLGTAIAFARGHQMNWYDGFNFRLGYIHASGKANGNSTGLQLTPNGVMIGNEGYYPVLNVVNVQSGVNYPQISNAPANAPVTIVAAGADPHIAVSIQSKGNAGVLTSAFLRSVDPTTADIPSGQCADWFNTTTGVFRHTCNFGNTLRSVVLQ